MMKKKKSPKVPPSKVKPYDLNDRYGTTPYIPPSLQKSIDASMKKKSNTPTAQEVAKMTPAQKAQITSLVRKDGTWQSQKTFKPATGQVGEMGEELASVLPGTGEVIDAKDVIKDLKAGEYAGAAASAAGFLIPVVPGKAVKKAVKELLPSTHAKRAYKKYYSGETPTKLEQLAMSPKKFENINTDKQYKYIYSKEDALRENDRVWRHPVVEKARNEKLQSKADEALLNLPAQIKDKVFDYESQTANVSSELAKKKLEHAYRKTAVDPSAADLFSEAINTFGSRGFDTARDDVYRITKAFSEKRDAMATADNVLSPAGNRMTRRLSVGRGKAIREAEAKLNEVQKGVDTHVANAESLKEKTSRYEDFLTKRFVQQQNVDNPFDMYAPGKEVYKDIINKAENERRLTDFTEKQIKERDKNKQLYKQVDKYDRYAQALSRQHYPDFPESVREKLHKVTPHMLSQRGNFMLPSLTDISDAEYEQILKASGGAEKYAYRGINLPEGGTSADIDRYLTTVPENYTGFGTRDGVVSYQADPTTAHFYATNHSARQGYEPFIGQLKTEGKLNEGALRNLYKHQILPPKVSGNIQKTLRSEFGIPVEGKSFGDLDANLERNIYNNETQYKARHRLSELIGKEYDAIVPTDQTQHYLKPVGVTPTVENLYTPEMFDRDVLVPAGRGTGNHSVKDRWSDTRTPSFMHQLALPGAVGLGVGVKKLTGDEDDKKKKYSQGGNILKGMAKNKKVLPKLGFGAKLFSHVRDLGLAATDMATNTLGMPNVITSDNYDTRMGTDIGDFQEKIAPIQAMAGQVGANLLLPGVGGKVMGAAQQIGGGVDAVNTAQQVAQDQINEKKNPYTQMMYGKGGGIHIKKANRGKFTAYKKRTGKTTEEALHSKDPHVRKMANFAKNSKKWHHKKSYGGEVEPQYEVEKDEVVQGNNIALEAGTQIANDMALVGGQKHTNGGTEGSGGDRVFSDQIVLSDGRTVAEHAEEIGKMKGKQDKKLNGTSRIGRNTANRMVSRYDMMLDELFTGQETHKSARQRETQGLPRMDTGGFNFAEVGQVKKPIVSKTDPFIPAAISANKTTGAPAAIQAYNSAIDPQTVANAAMAPTSKFDWSNALDTAMPYLDNAVNAAVINATPQVPKPILNRPAALDTTVDVSQQINDMQNMANRSAEAVNANTANSAVSNANRQGLYSKYLSGANQVFDNKQKVEQQLRNQDAINKQRVEMTNNDLLNQFNETNTKRTAGIQQDLSKNVAAGVEDYRQQGRDLKMDERDNGLIQLATTMNPNSAGYMANIPMLARVFAKDQAYLKREMARAGEGTEAYKELSKHLIK